ncbi:MAG: daunorubicin resistance ABC transporter ATPase [Promethearchaeota archaeon CR_4]|nr:MAG: daunorubicin resistance ABC transporter ATPase [Candidatus Lokiarchaeota archaeon CR_4]
MQQNFSITANGNEKGVLQIEHLTKIYDKHTIALEDLNWQIEPGYVYGILGPNGAGKSTLLKLIANLESPSTGRIKINTKEVRGNLGWTKENVGYCPQNPVFYSYLTVKENLRLIAELYNLRPKEYNATIDQLLVMFNLVEKQNELAKTLSGGQQKRLSILLALLHMPQILLLDEPTAGLDVESSRLIIDQIMTLRERGFTILLTTHDFSNIEVLCDQVLLLNMGKLVATGTPAEIIHNLVKDQQVIECVFTGGTEVLHQITSVSTGITVIEVENFCSNLVKVKLTIPGNSEIVTEFREKLQNSDKFSQVLVRKPTLLDAYLLVLNEARIHT